MDARAVAFIDGQSVHKSLKSIGLHESDLDWGRVFERLTPGGFRLVRAYWYEAARVSDLDGAAARATRHCPPGVDEQAFLRETREWHRAEQERLRHRQRTVHRPLVLEHDWLELRYAGRLEVDSYRRRRHGATGIDVAMAVDLVAKMDDYDAALLMGGHDDLAPAVEVLRDGRKRVYRVGLRPGAPGGREGAETVVMLHEEEIVDARNRFLKRQ